MSHECCSIVVIKPKEPRQVPPIAVVTEVFVMTLSIELTQALTSNVRAYCSSSTIDFLVSIYINGYYFQLPVTPRQNMQSINKPCWLSSS
jgi:uncharacterized membrane protein YczE